MAQPFSRAALQLPSLAALLLALCHAAAATDSSCGSSASLCEAEKPEHDDVVGMTQVMVDMKHGSLDVPAASGMRVAKPASRKQVEDAVGHASDPGLSVGTYVMALPGCELVDSDHVEFYRGGDRGRVSGFMSGSEKRILVTWERTGLTSSVTREGWSDIVRIIGALPELHEGDWLQALPNQRMQDEDGLVYEPGEFGVVVEVHGRGAGEASDAKGSSPSMVSVMWSKSQRVTTVSTLKWPKYFRYARIEGKNKSREGLNTDSALEVGALVQVKHVKVYAQCGDYCGEEFFNQTDLGRISGFMSEGNSRILVTWERTGKTSSLTRKYWSRFLRIIGKAPALKVGDWVQALPNQSRINNDTGAVIYQPLDFGRIVEANPPDLTISWSHSKMNSTTLLRQWPKELRLARPAELEPVSPSHQEA